MISKKKLVLMALMVIPGCYLCQSGSDTDGCCEEHPGKCLYTGRAQRQRKEQSFWPGL